MKEIWDSRYASEEYVYGVSPNEFFKNALVQYNISGKILLPAEGEGRNAIYAAKQGLEVTAFDISLEGKNKALKLAATEKVNIKYNVGDFFELDVVNEEYDCAALIFAHFPPSLLSKYHQKIGDLIKPGGMVILEGFSKENLPLRLANPKVGGPNQLEMLFSKEQIHNDFPYFEIIQLDETVVELNEGALHNGTGRVIRFVGRKISN